MYLKLIKRQTITRLSDDAASYRAHIESAINFLHDLANGQNSALPSILSGTPLGDALTEINTQIREVSLAQERQNWINTGVTDLGDVLRNKGGWDFQKLADETIKKIIGYVGANQGAIFIISETSDDTLEMLTCYAYGKKKHVSKTIGPGEGIAGQCVLEKQPIYLRHIPNDYIKITSGLGEATPREVLVSPLMINDEVYGVLELASFNTFDEHKREFLKRATEIIASSIRNARENDKIRTLLQASQQQSEELRAQEEEMRQNMEELQATQEEMERKNREVLRQAEEMKGVLRGINATMATIEFTPDGTVVNANENFLAVMEGTIDDIRGRHHKIFVPEAIAEGAEYRDFWNRLSQGEAIKGRFERVSLTGKRVWLDAIYNPIRDEHGGVSKVVKFASDVTQQNELLAESAGILAGVNATMATIEFEPDGSIITANDNFLQSMQYELSQIKGRHHRMFIPSEEVDSSAYKDFWRRLSQGEAFTGVFKRINANGETVLLKAVYNPIRNASGNVIKVVKFATVERVEVSDF